MSGKWPAHGRSRARRNAQRNAAYTHDLGLMAVMADRAGIAMKAMSEAVKEMHASLKELSR